MAINVEMPLHKARELMAPYRDAMPINNPLPEIDKEPPEAPNVLVDAVSLGGPSGPGQKPLVRHVLVKDLNKISTRMKFEHPKTGVFSNKAPMGLYALFDGQSCAGEPGPMAAEFCARNFHLKLMKRLAELTPETSDEASVQSALVGSFEDLDKELLANQPEVNDGCGAAVALLIGARLFTAVLGQCSAMVGSVPEPSRISPVLLGGRQGVVEGDFMRIRFAGGMVYGDGGAVRIRHPTGAESSVSRSLGDRFWKDPQVGALKAPLVVCIPDVQTFPLGTSEEHPFALLAASTVAAALTPQELVEIGGEYPSQPRASCGEIATRAQAARAGAAQCTAVEVSFLPPRDRGDDRKRAPGTAGPEPAPAYPAKKARVAFAPGGGTQSMRLRHIMVRYQDGPQKDGKKGLRTRQEAEAVLRQALGELRADLKACKKAPKDAMELVGVTSKKWAELCKRLSDCETARKGGTMCGDLGWLTPEALSTMGPVFKEVVDVLMPGQFSDIAATESGLHLVQRVA
mmetsp:Transcript_19519/g.52373  ORF Transcript_19519/g.52373 Transcript_19519/m.52373 type:complete len:515 (-) Transcript_19519:22-1566(-)